MSEERKVPEVEIDSKVENEKNNGEEQGYADAQNKLGFMYTKGRGARDDQQVLEWLRKAAGPGQAAAGSVRRIVPAQVIPSVNKGCQVGEGWTLATPMIECVN